MLHTRSQHGRERRAESHVRPRAQEHQRASFGTIAAFIQTHGKIPHGKHGCGNQQLSWQLDQDTRQHEDRPRIALRSTLGRLVEGAAVNEGGHEELLNVAEDCDEQEDGEGLVAVLDGVR